MVSRTESLIEFEGVVQHAPLIGEDIDLAHGKVSRDEFGECFVMVIEFAEGDAGRPSVSRALEANGKGGHATLQSYSSMVTTCSLPSYSSIRYLAPTGSSRMASLATRPLAALPSSST